MRETHAGLANALRWRMRDRQDPQQHRRGSAQLLRITAPG
jgi:hypothetical protein